MPTGNRKPSSAQRPLDAAADDRDTGDWPAVELYTDGACSGNPGPGGWAYILRHPASGKEIERAGSERETTNNRMELSAVIQGLTALKRPSVVDLYTDSQYVGKGLTEWMPKWKANGWRRGSGRDTQPVKNVELWQQLDELFHRHQVSFIYVPGHSGHPENERCDMLAVAAYQRYL
ncbi:MAG: ribonuclease HI [Pirellulales bacterium]